MIRRPPRSTQSRSSAASDVYKRQLLTRHSRGRVPIHHSREVGNPICTPSLGAFPYPGGRSGRRRCNSLRGNGTVPKCNSVTDTEPSRSVTVSVIPAEHVGSMRGVLLSNAGIHASFQERLLLGVVHNCEWYCSCLLYTSDAADDLLCVDLGGRRIIKKK